MEWMHAREVLYYTHKIYTIHVLVIHKKNGLHIHNNEDDYNKYMNAHITISCNK